MNELSKQFDLKAFVDQCDFKRPNWQSYMKYVCTQGNKEDFFSTMFASQLDDYLDLNYPNLFALNQHDDGLSSKVETKSEFYRYATSGLGKFTDIAIANTKDALTDLIEFKTDRHGAYINYSAMKDDCDISQLPQKYWKKTFNDISKLVDKKIAYPQTRIWVGTLLYSVQVMKNEFPYNYPKYYQDEPKRVKGIDASSFTQEILDYECANKCTRFIELLLRFKNALPRYGTSSGASRFSLDLQVEDFSLKTVARGSHRGVLVRSDLVLFEVKPT